MTGPSTTALVTCCYRLVAPRGDMSGFCNAIASPEGRGSTAATIFGHETGQKTDEP
jgi:hypothetical protein